MRRLTHPGFFKILLPFVMLTVLPVYVFAQNTPPPPDAIAELVGGCVACHGENGVPVVEDAPIIFGQEYYYMYVQMKDIQSGRRASEIMQPVLQDLDTDTLKALAKYFSERKWPDLQYATPLSLIHISEPTRR